MEENNEQDILIKQYNTDKADAIKAIKKFADTDEDKVNITWRSILGGDILQSHFLMRQVFFVMFIAVLMLIYTGNRYSGQQDAILIDSLQIRLQTEQYNTLTQASELSSHIIQSKIEDQLTANGDSALVGTVSSQTYRIDDGEE